MLTVEIVSLLRLDCIASINFLNYGQKMPNFGPCAKQKLTGVQKNSVVASVTKKEPLSKFDRLRFASAINIMQSETFSIFVA